MVKRFLRCLVLCSSLAGLRAQSLPGTAPLAPVEDRSAEMVAGMSRFLDRELAESVSAREARWRPDFSSREAYENSVAPNRARLAKILGVVDARVANPEMERVSLAAEGGPLVETAYFTAHAVRWPVFEGVHGEGLLLEPKQAAWGRIIVLPDADQTPEMICGLAPAAPTVIPYARRLAEEGYEVIVPTLIDRSDAFSGSVRLGRMTNQPHREWIYRQSYELGRHVIGYEVQKVLAAVDWCARQNAQAALPIKVAGWGEGGLIALCAGALDTRINVMLVSGYFGPRERMWQEPIYRNVFGLLREFGDAELARLIVPRALIIDPARAPEVAGPPAPRPKAAGAAPGRIATPTLAEVRAEVARARKGLEGFATAMVLQDANGDEHRQATIGEYAVSCLSWHTFDSAPVMETRGEKSRGVLPVKGRLVDPVLRQKRQVEELERFTQTLLARSRDVRDEFIWKKAKPTTPEQWREAMRPYRDAFMDEAMGRLPPSTIPLNPRSRLLFDRPTWTAHEVVLDVRPDIFAWGYLLLPKGMKPGERRPVVVVQHGLEGLPDSTIEEDPKTKAYATYKAFGVQLVERGFIVFAPHNPYRGEDKFRLLQRKANPLGQTLFTFIIAQHEQILAWLATLPQVDAKRIGFYGLSYGGKTAMRVPAALEGYALSICSGDFNEWVWKNSTTDWASSYMFTKEWEMPEFDLGSTFNYAEMAALIAPRPFMVERGHDDGVGLDEWVSFEYAKVKRLYDRLQIPDRTAIEYFVGPHTIHGVGTFKFLHHYLDWPEPATTR